MPCGEMEGVEIHEGEKQAKQAGKLGRYIGSLRTFTTVSFVDVTRIPIWYFLGSPLQIYSREESNVTFFRKFIRLTFGTDIGLLVKADVDDSYKFEVDDGIDKSGFHLLIYLDKSDGDFSIFAIPLLLSENVLLDHLKECQLQDQETLQSPVFVEKDHETDKNEILNKFAERTLSHPFMPIAGQFAPLKSSVISKSKTALAVPKPISKSIVTDQESLKKTTLSFINSEMRMRNIDSTDSDYQPLISNIFKSTMFAFRHDLNNHTDIKIDSVRDVVIRLTDILA